MPESNETVNFDEVDPTKNAGKSRSYEDAKNTEEAETKSYEEKPARNAISPKAQEIKTASSERVFDNPTGIEKQK